MTLDRNVERISSIPSALWPSDNSFGIPTLRLDMQPMGLVPPFTRWGRDARKSRMRGTWHMYTDDARFSRLWERPQDMLNSGCAATVEPNWSVTDGMPRVAALWATYRKRWLARTWQEHGVRVWVDLFVADCHADDNLLGVPLGWRAFATRGSSRSADDLEREVARVEARSDTTPSMVVYGGSRAVRELCAARGWLWLPEEADVARGRYEVARG